MPVEVPRKKALASSFERSELLTDMLVDAILACGDEGYSILLLYYTRRQEES